MTIAATQPTLFVPHGAPTFALRPGAAGAALVDLAKTLDRPQAIIIVSPHWETRDPTVGCAGDLETIYDFAGFPGELYTLTYPAHGNIPLAQRVAECLLAAGYPARIDPLRGLDHGAWVPLRMMYPEADIPVIPLSIQSSGDAAYHYRLGQALSGLPAQGILIVATGSITHNLRDYQLAAMNGGQTPAYVHEFARWIADQLAAGDTEALLDYRQRAPEARRAHPSDEHLLPLYVALGAAGQAATAERFHAGIDDYVIAMDAYAFTPGP